MELKRFSPSLRAFTLNLRRISQAFWCFGKLDYSCFCYVSLAFISPFESGPFLRISLERLTGFQRAQMMQALPFIVVKSITLQQFQPYVYLIQSSTRPVLGELAKMLTMIGRMMQGYVALHHWSIPSSTLANKLYSFMWPNSGDIAESTSRGHNARLPLLIHEELLLMLSLCNTHLSTFIHYSARLSVCPFTKRKGISCKAIAPWRWSIDIHICL